MRHKKHTTLALALTFLAPLTVGCSRTAKDPAATLAAACDAVERMDVEAYKQTLAADKWSNLQTVAAQSNISANDLLTQLMSNITCSGQPETTDTHFQGETATLNVKSIGSDETDRYRFVREGGDWKFAD